MLGIEISPSGPLHAPIMLISDFPSEMESEKGKAFLGPSFWELRKMLLSVGVKLDETYQTHVFNVQPSGNNLALFGTPDRLDPLGLGPLSSNPVVFLHPSHAHHIARLHSEILTVSPNIIVALGNTAAWALGLGTGISSLRGSVHVGRVPGLPRPVKVLPTYHPSAVLRQWDLRTIAVIDLQKAANESLSPVFSYDNSTLWLNPSLDDLVEFDRDHMVPSSICAADIETKRGQITCISFAPSVDHSLVVPFWIEGPDPNYWPTVGAEAVAWKFVRKQMERPDLVKVFQNGLYDLQYLQRYCRPRNCTEDTMLTSHSLWSELPKGLGFLGATFANVPSWKNMRTFRKEEQLKRDD